MSLLSVDELTVTFGGRGTREVNAVSGVSFSVDEGQVVGLVGESGCGKSVTSLALMGLLPRKGVRVGGRAMFRTGRGETTDLLTLGRSALRDLRGTQLAMIFQDPLSSLNPVVPIGVQVTEILTRHRGLRGQAARKEAAHLLERVGIPDPTRRLKEYPHQLSGGMRQRALIAMAVACAPRLLIADEPTTALDVTIQAQILELLKELVDDQGTALLMITHDLGVVAGMCDTVNVLYAGKVVEAAGRRPLFAAPAHPYAHGLLGSIPRLDAPRGEPLNPIRGSINDTIAWEDGCAFAPRCDFYTDACLRGTPRLGPLPGGDGHDVRCVNPVLTGPPETATLSASGEEATASGGKQPASGGGTSAPLEAGEATASGGKPVPGAQPASGGGAAPGEDAGGTRKTEDARETQEAGGTRETQEAGGTRGTGEAQETGDAGESGKTEDAGEAGESGKTEDAAGEPREPQEAQEPRGTGEAQDVGEDRGTLDTGETRKTKDAGETGETGETGKDPAVGGGSDEDTGTGSGTEASA